MKNKKTFINAYRKYVANCVTRLTSSTYSQCVTFLMVAIFARYCDNMKRNP